MEELIDIETKKIIYCLSKTDLMSEDEKFSIYNKLEDINIEKNIMQQFNVYLLKILMGY